MSNGVQSTPAIDWPAVLAHSFDAIAVASICQRLQLVYMVLTDETFARRCFKAYSATAQVRVAAALCTAAEIEVG